MQGQATLSLNLAGSSSGIVPCFYSSGGGRASPQHQPGPLHHLLTAPSAFSISNHLAGEYPVETLISASCCRAALHSGEIQEHPTRGSRAAAAAMMVRSLSMVGRLVRASTDLSWSRFTIAEIVGLLPALANAAAAPASIAHGRSDNALQCSGPLLRP